MNTKLAVTVLAAGVLLAGCSSKWNYVRDAPRGKVSTILEVRSEPPGAEVTLDGRYLGKAPFELPVVYAYEARIYQRRTTVPIPGVDEKLVKSYHHNVVELVATLMDYVVTKHDVTMAGEERLEVVIELRPLGN